MNNEPSEREIIKTIPFIIASKGIKYLGINQEGETLALRTTKTMYYKTLLLFPESGVQVGIREQKWEKDLGLGSERRLNRPLGPHHQGPGWPEGQYFIYLRPVSVAHSFSIYWDSWYIKMWVFWEFPGGPVIRTWHVHCRCLGSIPGRGTKIPQATQGVQKKKVDF